MSDAMSAGMLMASQHLWQSAVALGTAWAVLRFQPHLDANVRSWVWLFAFLFAVTAPFAVFLPSLRLSTIASHETAKVVPTVHAVQVVVDTVPAHAATSFAVPAEAAGVARDLLLALWAAGVAYGTLRVAVSMVRAGRLRDDSVPWNGRPPQGPVPGRMAMRISDTIVAPMVVGLLRPVILIPRYLLETLSADDLDHLLRHEVAHLERRDLWQNLIQRVGQAVFWWNPLLMMIGSRLDLAREMACDERAARQGGPMTYASALLSGADAVFGQRRNDPVFSAGVFGSRQSLSQRIRGLIDMNGKHRISGARGTVFACGLLVLTTVPLALVATPRFDAASVSTSEAMTAAQDSAARLLAVVEDGDLDKVQQLVAKGADVNAGVPGDGTPLIVASKRGNVAMINLLLSLGANVDGALEGDGNPMTAASMNGQLAVVKVLVTARANVNAVIEYDETPLINAVRGGHLNVVTYLVNHDANVNLGAVTETGQWRSPLNQAHDPAIRDYLLSKGAVIGGP
jgi:beta-lactamase regulating signal transducer with metallopeptidase domain